MHYARDTVQEVPSLQSPTSVRYPGDDCILYRLQVRGLRATGYLTNGAGLFGRFANTDAGGAKFQTMTSPSSILVSHVSLHLSLFLHSYRVYGADGTGRDWTEYSPEPEMIISSDSWREVTAPRWPTNVWTQFPDSLSHTLTVRSVIPSAWGYTFNGGIVWRGRTVGCRGDSEGVDIYTPNSFNMTKFNQHVAHAHQ